MPTYSYTCMVCDTDETRIQIKIADRDNQRCNECGYSLKRGIDRVGAVYAPTASSGGTLK